MNIKTLVQLLIFFIIIIFVYLFINNTFLKEKKDIVNLDIKKDKTIDEVENENNESTIIEKLNYISIDAKGNEYILNAEYGRESVENSDIIILEKVTGLIKLSNKSNIKIRSDFAKYNSTTFDTNFYQNVFGFFEESKVSSDNLDLFFNNNEAIMYNNITYTDGNTLAKADEILFDLLNGNINIKMFNENNKVLIIKN